MLTVVGPVGADAHDGGRHPERPLRIGAVMDGVGDVGRELGSSLVLVPAEPAPRPALERVHTAAYVTQVELLCAGGGGRIDPDTFVVADSWDAALRSAGAGLQAVDVLRAGSDASDVAFVATRPPGHHAVPDRGMGFCVFNNVAVTAAALVAEGERVLIVDWDVHHGNGTQDVFWDDPAVLYVSTHQSPLYPGSGAPEEVGGPGAVGLTLNVPLPAGATGDVVRRALDEVVAPAAEAFAPTWVLVSAGFDAHRADPLAELALSSGDFGDLARTVAGFGPRGGAGGRAGGRLVVFLEGGYDLDALRASVAVTLGALTGVDATRLPGAEAVTSGGPGAGAVVQAAAVRRRMVDAALE